MAAPIFSYIVDIRFTTNIENHDALGIECEVLMVKKNTIRLVSRMFLGYSCELRTGCNNRCLMDTGAREQHSLSVTTYRGSLLRMLISL